MGFLDRFKKKEGAQASKTELQETQQSSTQTGTGSSGKRIKKYTSDGKPVYE